MADRPALHAENTGSSHLVKEEEEKKEIIHQCLWQRVLTQHPSLTAATIRCAACNDATDVSEIKPRTNHYCVIWAMWHYPDHHCAICVVITLRINLPTLYAEAIELIPTRKWQLVMWGKMDFAMLCYTARDPETILSILLSVGWIGSFVKCAVHE